MSKAKKRIKLNKTVPVPVANNNPVPQPAIQPNPSPPPAPSQDFLESDFVSFVKALVVGASSVGFVFLIFWIFADFNVPENWKISKGIWHFWTSLIAGMVFASLVLLVASKVTTNRKNFTKGIKTAMILTFLVIFAWYYGFSDYYGKNERLSEDKIEKVYSNPHSGYRASFSFVLDRGQESSWQTLPSDAKLRSWGKKGNYDVIYEDGVVISFRNGKRMNSIRSHSSSLKFKVLSLSDDQEILIYLIR